MLTYLEGEQVIPLRQQYLPLFSPYRPDIVIHNKESNSVALLELTCPLDSVRHLELARDRKLKKEEYQLLLSELDRLGIVS